MHQLGPFAPPKKPLFLTHISRAGLRARAATVGVLLLAAGTAQGQSTPAGIAPIGGVAAIGYDIVRSIDHDTGAFTQGLLWHADKLYESTGQYGGLSSVRRLSSDTGAIEVGLKLPDQLFGEGLARVGNKLIQLTWKKQVALEYDVEPLRHTGEVFRYRGEGWGLCFDGKVLWMSDGSSELRIRRADNFAAIGKRRVTYAGKALDRLNELECVGEHVYANVWQSDLIVRIKKSNGRVDGVLNARTLFPRRSPEHGVLNGIAHDPIRNTFFLTGKYWPKIYEVRLR